MGGEEEEEGGDAVTGDVCVMVGGGVTGDAGRSSSTTWMGGVTIRGIGESMIHSLHWPLTRDFLL